MSFNYAGLSATAARLLGDKGQQMTLRKRAPGTYDPVTGSATVTSTDYTVTGAVFPYAAVMIDGTRIKIGDKRALIAAEGLSVEPEQDDYLVIGAVQHNVVAVRAVSPAGVAIVYEAQVRR